MKTNIICIVGPSGSGKTYMSQYLKKIAKIPYVVSCTTRPMRVGEKDGVDHWFVSPADLRVDRQNNDILAYTRYGGYEYWAKHSDIVKFRTVSYVIDEEGLKMLMDKFSYKYNIISVYVDSPEKMRLNNGVTKERIERDKERETLPEKAYTYILHNDGTIEEFNEKIKSIIADGI